MRNLPQMYALINLSKDKISLTPAAGMCGIWVFSDSAITKNRVTIEKLGNVNPTKPCLHVHNEELPC